MNIYPKISNFSNFLNYNYFWIFKDYVYIYYKAIGKMLIIEKAQKDVYKSIENRALHNNPCQ